jgi:hypothetical protein
MFPTYSAVTALGSMPASAIAAEIADFPMSLHRGKHSQRGGRVNSWRNIQAVESTTAVPLSHGCKKKHILRDLIVAPFLRVIGTMPWPAR